MPARMLNPDREFLLRHVRFNKTMINGDGAHLVDEEGNDYLDFLAQYGAVPFGHNAKFLWETLDATRSSHTPAMVQPFYTPASKALAQRLLEIDPFDHRHVTFTNSGAESVEVAFKMARAATGRRKIICLDLAFHGKTHGALCATGNPVYSQPFLIESDDFIKVAPESMEDARRAFGEVDVAAFIIEPVLGEGGMIPLSHEYVQYVAGLCREHGALFIVDEIQTGLGRIGEMFAITRTENVVPDIICLAKALGGGMMPIGAVLSASTAWTEEIGLYHSSTFANNQLACQVALAVVNRLTGDQGQLLDHVKQVSRYLEDGLDEVVSMYPDIFAGRSGAGLMQGLRIRPLDGEESYFLSHASHHGYLVPLICGYLVNTRRVIVAPLFNRKDILRIEPPLVIEHKHIDELCDALKECAEHIRHRHFSSLLAYLIGRTPQELNYSEATDIQARLVRPAEAISPRNEERLGSFAFFIHPTTEEDLINIMPGSITRLNETHRAEFREWMNSWFSRRYEPAPVYHASKIRSTMGGYVEGWLIACPLTPEKMMRLPKRRRIKLLDQYMAVAKELGVDMVGLGAFTSIISRGGTDLLKYGINITTGNSFTAIASAESLHKALCGARAPSSQTTVAVIGAAGSVGRIAAINLSEKYANLFLVGNPNNKRSLENLEEIAGEIYSHAILRLQKGLHTGLSKFIKNNTDDLFGLLNACNGELLGNDNPDYKLIKRLVEEKLRMAATIKLSIDLDEVLPQAHGVLSATSQGKSFIDAGALRQNAVVCDAARPPDLNSVVLKSRSDVLVYEGGVVRFVEPYEFGRANILGFDKNVNLACLSETVVLAMSGVRRPYSIGNRIPYDEAYRVYKLAQSHGFSECIATTQGELEVSEYVEN